MTQILAVHKLWSGYVSIYWMLWYFMDSSSQTSWLQDKLKVRSNSDKTDFNSCFELGAAFRVVLSDGVWSSAWPLQQLPETAGILNKLEKRTLDERDAPSQKPVYTAYDFYRVIISNHNFSKIAISTRTAFPNDIDFQNINYRIKWYRQTFIVQVLLPPLDTKSLTAL